MGELDLRKKELLDAFKRANPGARRSTRSLWDQKTLLSGVNNARRTPELPHSIFDHAERWYLSGDRRAIFSVSHVYDPLEKDYRMDLAEGLSLENLGVDYSWYYPDATHMIVVARPDVLNRLKLDYQIQTST